MSEWQSKCSTRLSIAGRTIWSEGFGHDVPEDFEGDNFDFDVFSGSGQGDVAELFAQVGGISSGADGMKICLGHKILLVGSRVSSYNWIRQYVSKHRTIDSFIVDSNGYDVNNWCF